MSFRVEFNRPWPASSNQYSLDARRAGEVSGKGERRRHYQLGLALLKKGERAEAQAEFEKARQLDPHLKPPLE